MDIEQKEKMKNYIANTVCMIMLGDLEDSKNNFSLRKRNEAIDHILGGNKLIIPYLLNQVDFFTIQRIGKHIFQIHRLTHILKETYIQYSGKKGNKKRTTIRNYIENHICYIREILMEQEKHMP